MFLWGFEFRVERTDFITTVERQSQIAVTLRHVSRLTVFRDNDCNTRPWSDSLRVAQRFAKRREISVRELDSLDLRNHNTRMRRMSKAEGQKSDNQTAGG